jgi:hypothetical protein
MSSQIPPTKEPTPVGAQFIAKWTGKVWILGDQLDPAVAKRLNQLNHEPGIPHPDAPRPSKGQQYIREIKKFLVGGSDYRPLILVGSGLIACFFLGRLSGKLIRRDRNAGDHDTRHQEPHSARISSPSLNLSGKIHQTGVHKNLQLLAKIL